MTSHQESLTVGFDARDLLLTHRTGVECVLYQLLLNLPEQLPDCQLVLFIDQALSKDTARHVDITHLVSLGYRLVAIPARFPKLQKLFDVWLAWQMRAVLKAHHIDVFYSVNTKFPIGFTPSVVTIHGIEWHAYPEGYRKLERCKQWLWFQLATRFSQSIVTFAEHTRHDVLRVRKNCVIPVLKVPEGVAAIFKVLDSKHLDQSITKRYGIQQPFILSVCSLVPRKNLDGLLQAYARLTHQFQISQQLVLVGKNGWKAEQLQQMVDDLKLRGRVIFTGYVPESDLIQLYNQAALFVYPSKYEGFGLPPLEAMRCGIPVVTSNRSATKEIGEGAAILVNPDDIKSIADGIYQGLTDHALRRQLIDAGLKRAEEYSWVSMAQAIATLLVSMKYKTDFN